MMFYIVTPTFPGKVNQTVNASAGENVTLVCNAEGLPLPNITWFKNGSPVEETETVVIRETKGNRNRNSTLTLYGVDHTADGRYYCTASNFLFVFFINTSPVTSIVVHCEFSVTNNCQCIALNRSC